MRTRMVCALAVVAVALAATAAGAGAATLLRLDGIGPLKLGMTRTAAVATGWFGKAGTGCPLGGPPLPITYQLKGPKAPSGIQGTAQFDGGKLTNLSFSHGVRTATGVHVGTKLTRMVTVYRAAGDKVKSVYSPTFAGRFVDVSQGGKPLIGAFGAKGAVEVLSLTAVPVCE